MVMRLGPWATTRLAAAIATLAVLAACHDTTFLTGSEVSGEGWCGVTELFDSECTSCHSPTGGVLGGLDLQTDAHGALVEVASANPGRTLVVPGDPAASFLLTKLEDAQTDTEGGVMPPPGALPQETIDVVSQWIADGASDVCDDGTVPSTCDPTNEECGPGLCSGFGELMLPGADCLQCHDGTVAPTFSAAGTAFVDGDGSAPLQDAVVHILDADGTTVDLTTNEVGNFYTTEALTLPYTVSIEANGTTLDMSTQPTSGSCNSCHSCEGPAGGKLFGATQ